MGMSQMCTEAGDYFRTSKPHSEKLWPTIQIKNHTLLRLAAVWPQDDLNLMLSATSSPQPPPVWAGQHGAQMQQPAPVDWIHCIASLSLVP